MKYRRLGKSGIRVSEIGFGAWTIALDWWGKKIDEDEARRMLKKAYDEGITLFETADMYGKGKSERLIGEALGGVRDDIVISTKYGYDYAGVEQVGHAELPQRFDPEFTRRALDMSLERLGTDKVDVYGLHNPKLHHIRDGESFAFLNGLMREGSVGAFRWRSDRPSDGPRRGWRPCPRRASPPYRPYTTYWSRRPVMCSWSGPPKATRPYWYACPTLRAYLLAR